MLKDRIEMLHLVSSEQNASDLPVASREDDGYWFYTTDGYVWVSTTPWPAVQTDDSRQLASAFIETCF
jgi:hypothetical protein